MSTVRTTLAATVPEVWAALIDARTYPRWLIGAKRIRRVDDGWPAPGTAFHHEVGLGGPVTIADRTRCVSLDPQRCLELDVRARPLVHATVTFRLTPVADGTEVSLEEHPNGVHRLLTPLMGPLVAGRNKASLAKLGQVLEGHRAP